MESSKRRFNFLSNPALALEAGIGIMNNTLLNLLNWLQLSRKHLSKYSVFMADKPTKDTKHVSGRFTKIALTRTQTETKTETCLFLPKITYLPSFPTTSVPCDS